MNQNRRTFLASSLSASFVLFPAAKSLAAPAAGRVFTPEMFGAKGDGVANDSKAMAALAEAVNASGGGTVRFRKTVYKVGGQRATNDPKAGYAFEPVPILDFKGCRSALVIRGNGATLRCEAGLRYGMFTLDGAKADHGPNFTGPGAASPYMNMIKIEDCSGPVHVSNLELDGNLRTLKVGGRYGDTGWQLPAAGLALVNNRGPEFVENIHTHHHAFDGLYIDGVSAKTAPRASRRIVNVRAENNGRQGCSLVGGLGYEFDRCTFSGTGRAGIASAPGAGVDLEAEGGKTIREISFTECRFADNIGCGMVADTGPTSDVRFIACTFVGTTSWSAWPNKPGMQFRSCTFAGALCRAWGDADPTRAAQFLDCTFTDDPRLSPTGTLYGGDNSDRPLADLSDSKNMLFQRCRFLATHSAVLPWSYGAIYQDCRMEQTSRTLAFPRGTFLGSTIIDGAVNITGSRIPGEVIINGRRYANTHV